MMTSKENHKLGQKTEIEVETDTEVIPEGKDVITAEELLYYKSLNQGKLQVTVKLPQICCTRNGRQGI